MQKTFATLLASDDYLPGVLVLHQSLKKTGTREGFLVLVTPEVSPPVLACLAGCGIPTRPVAPLESPYAGLANPAYLRVFTKLRIFELVDYQKVVYLDTDMLVCAGIDALFEKPAWSAVNAGGMLPEKADWVQLNAGLLVVAPDADVFREMAHLKDILPSSDGGDQGFLQAYRPQWPDEPHLHLDHAYNLFVGHADRYARLFGYHLPPAGRAPDDRTIRVLHFWGEFKPWRYGRVDDEDALYNDAFQMWWEVFDEVITAHPAACRHGAAGDLLRHAARQRTRTLADLPAGDPLTL